MYNKQQLISKIEALPEFEIKELTEAGESEPDKYWKGVREVNKKGVITPVSKHYVITQFKEIFLPLLNAVGECKGDLKYYYGSGILMLYPEGEQFRVKEGKVGILITNSVDRTMGININFSVLMENVAGGYLQVILPKKLTQFNKKHMGNVNKVIENYQKLLANVQDCWKTILEKFDRELNDEEVDSLLKRLNLGKKYNKFIKEVYKIQEKSVKLWDVFIDGIVFLSEKRYKNEFNRIKRLKKVADIVYSYSVLEQLR